MSKAKANNVSDAPEFLALVREGAKWRAVARARNAGCVAAAEGKFLAAGVRCDAAAWAPRVTRQRNYAGEIPGGAPLVVVSDLDEMRFRLERAEASPGGFMADFWRDRYEAELAAAAAGGAVG